MQQAFTTCTVCWILDHDSRPKLCSYCGTCDAWVCERDQKNYLRRALAMARRALAR